MTRDEITSVIDLIENEHGTYLIETLTRTAGFFTNERQLLYIAEDFFDYPSEGIDTEYLRLQTHVRITSIENHPTFEDGYYNIIIFKGSLSDGNLESFLRLCEIHAKNAEELTFKDFFYSLIALFQLPTDQQYKNAVGLYGELKFIEYVYKLSGKDISLKWHRNGLFSKYDFSNGFSNIEVKTTSTDQMNVIIKHQQVFGRHPCVLSVALCDEDDNGETIEALINSMQGINGAFNSVNFSMNLAKELKRLSVHDIRELKFEVRRFILFNTREINPFPTIPTDVSELTYRLDISDLPSLMDNQIEEFLTEF